jgi:hypothetical protein
VVRIGPQGGATTPFGLDGESSTKDVEDVVASPQGAPQTTAPGRNLGAGAGLTLYVPAICGFRRQAAVRDIHQYEETKNAA